MYQPTSVEYQFDGWPVGFEDEDKKALTACVQRLLSDNEPRPLWIIHDTIKRDPEAPEAFRRAAFLDYTHAAIDRAARAVEHVESGYWIPKR